MTKINSDIRYIAKAKEVKSPKLKKIKDGTIIKSKKTGKKWKILGLENNYYVIVTIDDFKEKTYWLNKKNLDKNWIVTKEILEDKINVGLNR